MKCYDTNQSQPRRSVNLKRPDVLVECLWRWVANLIKVIAQRAVDHRSPLTKRVNQQLIMIHESEGFGEDRIWSYEFVKGPIFGYHLIFSNPRESSKTESVIMQECEFG
jgi:hypothetical protein